MKVYCDIDASAWLTFADVLGACSHKAIKQVDLRDVAPPCLTVVENQKKKSIKPGDAEGYGLRIDPILNGRSSNCILF